jgi:hypothetical protein
MRWEVPDRSTLALPTLIAARTGEVLRRRLYERLRLKEAGVYWVLANLGHDPFPAATHGSITFATYTSLAPSLVKAAKEEIETLKRDGPTEQEWALLLADPPQGFAEQVSAREIYRSYLAVGGDIAALQSLRQERPTRETVAAYIRGLPSGADLVVDYVPAS